MVNSGRNRFELDDGADQEFFTEDADSVFKSSAIAAGKRRRRFRFFLTASLLILLTAAFSGILYFYFRNDLKNAWNAVFSKDSEADQLQNKTGGQFLDEKIRNLDLESLKERYFFPDVTVSPPLASAISAYKTNDRSRAVREFEKFLESSANDKEKAIALVYMGIMAMETENYQLAKHHLERSLKYDEASVAALVNLAMAEQKMGNLADAKIHIAKAENSIPKIRTFPSSPGI